MSKRHLPNNSETGAIVRASNRAGARTAQVFPRARQSSTHLALPDGLSFEDWAECGRRLARVRSALQWHIGDWWIYGEHHYGFRARTMEEAGGPALQTCMNYGSVCRAFKKTSRRREVLSFSHHAEVAAVPEPEADRLLDWCEVSVRADG